ncbi:MAG: Asp-tRNA(Asn)/Glu-tRNA(Gln) amidotransferase subunit GatA [Clostridia bacterium]|nr:Asp-tRNA(Asn)/Glu-tRNA(Gln) amidotransferase subunit GatA [Clostridia bacterium]
MELYLKMGYELSELLAKKEVSAREVTESFLARTDAVEGSLSAYLCRDAEGALAVADKVDAQRAEGAALSPLAGLPLAVKDNICTLSLPTTAASKMLAGYVSPYEATAVARLRGFDMPIVGKTNLDEFGLGSTGESSVAQVTKNPYDLTRTPGGSSSGSAAAVAAATVPFALGSDTGGGLRLPAAFTGTVALKPTYGTVSRYGLIAVGSSFDQIGPMTRSVRDNALLFDALVAGGADHMDGTSIPGERTPIAPALTGEVKGLRIGLPKQYFGAEIDPAVAACVKAAALGLEKLGAELVEVDLPHFELALPTYRILADAEASSNLARFDGIRFGYRAADYEDSIDLYFKSRGEALGPEVRRRSLVGAAVLSNARYDDYYKRARLMRIRFTEAYTAALAQCDLLLTPAAATTAFKLGEKTDPLALYQTDLCTVGASLAGLPALVLPCGSVEGLPVGLQLIGRRFEEAVLYNAGYAFEQSAAAGWTCPVL